MIVIDLLEIRCPECGKVMVIANDDGEFPDGWRRELASDLLARYVVCHDCEIYSKQVKPLP